MKVLHVAPSAARRDGGPSEVLRGQLPALRRLGLDVRLVVSDKGMTLGDDDVRGHPDTLTLRSVPPRSLNLAAGTVPALRRAVAWSDVVHVHSVDTAMTSIALRVAKRIGRPVLLQPHGALDRYHRRQGSFKKSIYRSLIDADVLASISGAIYSSQREAEQGGEVLRATPYMVPLGVDSSLFEVQRDPQPGVILFLGRVTAKKRLDLVLEALAAPMATGLSLVVAGPVDPALHFDPARRARELGIENRVTFLGQVDERQRRDLLRTAAIFCLPSDDESFGVAAAEALAAGCPAVLSSEVGIAPAAATQGAAVITGRSAPELAEVLTSLLTENSAIAKISAAGRNYAASHFTWAESARAAHKAYESVTGRSRHA